MARSKAPKKAEPTAEKLPAHLRDDLKFKPGQSGNPSGRPKGSRNALGEAFLEAMHEDFKAHGAATIVKVREEKPDQYLKVVASILPKDLNVNVNHLNELSDDELRGRIRELESVIRPFLAGEGVSGAPGGAGPSSTH